MTQFSSLSRSKAKRSLGALAVLSASALFAAPALAERGGYGPSITLFDGNGFRGAAVTLDGAETRLPRARFNDRASSIAIDGGAWELCSDSDFRGRCEVVSGDIGDLRVIRLNNSISSVRPVGRHAVRRDRRQRGGGYGHDNHGGHHGYGAQYGYSAPVVLHTDARFGGRAIPIDGAIAHLSRIRANDSVSSIRVEAGTWLVCTDPNFRGRCEIIDGSVRNLSNWRLNDTISSIRPYQGRGGRDYAYMRKRTR